MLLDFEGDLQVSKLEVQIGARHANGRIVQAPVSPTPWLRRTNDFPRNRMAGAMRGFDAQENYEEAGLEDLFAG